ncbi:MAG: hypothetical protein ACJA2S_000941, partial [Cyclobacteriaceae bacterium]
MDSGVLINILNKLDIEVQYQQDDLVIKDKHNNLDADLIDLVKVNKKNLLEHLRLDHLKPKLVAPHSKATEEQDFFPLSHAQKRLWLIEQIGDTHGVYNISSVYDFQDIDISLFEKALNQLLIRHEILRTIFVPIYGEPKQVICSLEKFKMSFTDLSSASDIRGEFVTIKAKEKYQDFDLSKAPLTKSHLVKLDESRYKFIFTVHHIISDAWSMRNIEREFFQLYSYLTEGQQADLPILPFQYKDYTCDQLNSLSNGRISKESSFWLSKFKEGVPVLALPIDKKRPSKKTYNGGEQTFFVKERLTKRIKEKCLQHNCSTFMLLLATTNTLLYKYTNQTDIVIGIPSSGRNDLDLSNQVGFYVNTLLISTSFSEEKSFNDLLLSVRGETLSAYDNQLFPFDLLVEELNQKRDLSRSPLFDVMAVMEETDEELYLEESTSTDFVFKKVDTNNVSKFDLTFTFVAFKNGVEVTVNYNTDLFHSTTIDRLLNHFTALLTTVLDQGDVSLKDLDYLGEGE